MTRVRRMRFAAGLSMVCVAHCFCATSLAQLPQPIPTPEPVATPDLSGVTNSINGQVITVIAQQMQTAKDTSRSVVAAIYYGAATPLLPKSDDGTFEQIALQPEQAVTVVLSGYAAQIGLRATVEAADGGTLSAAAPASSPSPTASPPVDVIISPPPLGGDPQPNPLPSPSTTPSPPRVAPVSGLTFSFQAYKAPGAYRVFIWTQTTNLELRFRVVDPAHPLPPNSRILRAY